MGKYEYTFACREDKFKSKSYEIYSIYLVYLFNGISTFLSYLLPKFDSLVNVVFANGPGDLGSIPGRVIPKTLKMVLDTSLLNTQQYKLHIKGKVEQSRERSCALPNTSV